MKYNINLSEENDETKKTKSENKVIENKTPENKNEKSPFRLFANDNTYPNKT